jgi:hypothetical protein
MGIAKTISVAAVVIGFLLAWKYAFDERQRRRLALCFKTGLVTLFEWAIPLAFEKLAEIATARKRLT